MGFFKNVADAGRDVVNAASRVHSVNKDPEQYKAITGHYPIIAGKRIEKQQRDEQRQKEKELWQKDYDAKTQAAVDAQNKWMSLPPGPEKDAAYKEYKSAMSEWSKSGSNKPDHMKNMAEKMADKASAAGGGVGSAMGGALQAVAAMGGNKMLQNAEDPTRAAAHANRQADIYEQMAADEQMNAQQEARIANSDYRVEADKNAMAQSAVHDSQKIQKMGNVSAAAAALERGDEDADYDTHMARSDEARQRGKEDKRNMYGAKDAAEDARSLADSRNYHANEVNKANLTSQALSTPPADANEGSPDAEGGGEAEQQEEQQQEEEAGGNEAEEDSGAGEEGTGEAEAEGGGEGDAPSEPAPSGGGDASAGNYQHVINALLGSSKGQDLRDGSADNPDDLALYNATLEKYGVTPMEPGSHANEKDPNTWEAEFIKKQGANAQQAMDDLRQGRVGAGNDKNMNGVRKDGKLVSETTGQFMDYNSNGTGSDMRVKNIIKAVKQFKYF